MKREEGFYWVKHNGGWIIAFWYDDKEWYITGSEVMFEDYDFDEISINRLTHEP
jgi:hypothetical protein